MSLRPKLKNDVPRFVEQSHGQTAGWLGQSFDKLEADAAIFCRNGRGGRQSVFTPTNSGIGNRRFQLIPFRLYAS